METGGVSQRALITGVTGFAGTFLAEHLLAHGDAVLGALYDGLWSDIVPAELRDRVAFVAWDIAEELPAASLERIAAFRPDVIYHLAALSIPAECGETEPVERATAVNVQGTRRVVELCVRLAQRPRLLLTSSAYVYGPAAQDALPVDERAPLRPVRAYGRTKLAAEQEVLRGAGRVWARCDHRAQPSSTPDRGRTTG